MHKAIHIKLNPDKRTREYCQFLQQESAHVWNRTKNFFWRTFRKKEIWLKSTSLQKYNTRDQLYPDEPFALHSQSIQSVAQQFSANLKAAHEVRKTNPSIRYPYKNKKYFRVQWKTGAIKIKSRNIILNNGRGNKPLKIRLPRTLANCTPKIVELIWHNGYWLSLIVEVDDKESVIGTGIAACDMGEIHAIAMTDGYDALIISGRKLRAVKQYRNKVIAQLQEKMSKCVKYSRRWNKLNRTKQRVQERTRRRVKDLNHKITTLTIQWCVDHNITTLVIGDLSGIAQNTKGRLARIARQKISQWSFYTQKEYLQYKAKEVGIEVVEVSEASTSRTCPRCGTINRSKNRNYSCSNCKLKCHRDVVGAYNILTVHQYGSLVPDDLFPYPQAKYLRIPFVGKSSSSPDGGLMVVSGNKPSRAKSMCCLAYAANQ
ncbi:IS200/IS605 family element transposase accessory protein TnpB [bacterium]|nr:IS200/IS605 family element transposase accessory protein TnpB [bacterium]